MVNVGKELEVLRQSLLDLSLRNNLLNYRPSQKRTISITGRYPEEIYELFVLHEKSMRFRANTRSRKSKNSENEEEEEDETSEKESRVLKTIGKILVSEEKSAQSTRSETFLDTPDDSDTLERKLFYVFNQANSIFEEQGYPVLYLAVGFLQWSDSKSSVKNSKAPLLLVPVELRRIGKGRNFSVQWTGDEIFASITLQAKMKEFGIQIPDFETPDEAVGIENYFKTVSAAIKDKKDWIFLPEVCIDFFNFRKFVMYKDLDPATWPEDMSPAEHPLIQKIFNPQEPEFEISGFLEEEVDLRLSAKDTFHIMDADSSQIAVIEDVKAGKNLVVEGPPGTGKSQTIANTIAELMARGKSVLFVSEKMAALQVVKNRLDAAGLGELCLEIHSNQTRKKAVLEELEKTLKRAAPAPISPDKDLNELEKLKHELNEYALSLEKPAGNLYSSLYTLYGVREKIRAYFEAKGSKMPRYQFQDPETWGPDAWTETESILEKMGQVLPVLGPARKNPWYGCDPGFILPSDLGEIEPLTEECARAFGALEATTKTLNDLSATSKPSTLKEIETIIDAAELLENSKPLPAKMLQNPEWDSDSSREDAEALISKLRQYRELKTFVDKTFQPSVLKLNTSEFEELSSKFLKIVNPRYRKLKKEIAACYIAGAPSQDSKILLDLACISECETHRLELEEAEAKGKKYFWEYWKGFESDPVLLEEYVRWIIPFRKSLTENIFTDRSIRLVENGIDRAALESAINEVTVAKKVFLEALEKVGMCIGADFEKMFGKDLEAVKISQLKSRVNSWKTDLSSLVFWSQYLGYRQTCLETKAAPMIEDIEAGKIEACDITPVFEGNYSEILLHRALRERPALFTFIREMHEGRINKFIELDKKVLLENRKRITCSAYEEAPKLTSGASRASEAGILLNEFNRKRGHMPIRTLMKKAGGLIQKIKPCFLMSPLSIAQYLDPRSTRFDVIIFDEASQVRPEDAVGALLRGKQVVVMGDSKQLPPTDFFDTVVDSPESDPDDYTSAGDMESILNVCKRSFPVKTLRWHYRSRHESLIAISNQEFYDNRLYIYPSPMQKDESLGLKFVHLPDSVYDRGRSGANRVEARAVARAVFEHFSRHPDKSLGVGTFNIKQQEAIQDEIEALLKMNPGFDLNQKNERSEHFFVKNLETIQGDERDVILLSVGFGFDSSRKLSLNFGPLNREGGERRLNVLITRAREKCVVFSNFTSRDLNLDENSPVGLRALKTFLGFAESGDLPLPACSREGFGSPFEETVSDFLTENGCEIHRQIGCAGYRLDLAVPDPVHPGRYVLGIECDGAAYHSSHVARDRDRLRQQVLEGLGWKIYRVWSTDWYLRPRESKEKLLEAVKEAVKQARLQAKSEPEPEIPIINEPSSWTMLSNKGSTGRLLLSNQDSVLPANSASSASHFFSSADFPLPAAIIENKESMGSTSIIESKASTESKTSTESKNGTESRIGTGSKADIQSKADIVNRVSTESKLSEEDISKNFKTNLFEAKPELITSFESEIEDSYSSSSLKIGEGFTVSSDEDFLPEMALRTRSMALLADGNSRKKPVRRSRKSKILKFNVDPSSEEIETSKLIPEPEPEKMNFFQAYPEIDFSAGTEKKRKRKRLNEFAYIYGSGNDFESEPDYEEDSYMSAPWDLEPEITSEPEVTSEPEITSGSEITSESESSAFESEFKYGTRTRPTSENKPRSDSTDSSGFETNHKGKSLKNLLQSTAPEEEDEIYTENASECLYDNISGKAGVPSGTQERYEKSERLSAEKLSDDQLSVKNDSLETSVPLYRICPFSGLQESGDLSELSDKQLEEAIIRIIEYEGPIHAEALLQRIKSEAGVPRMLGKIKQKIFDVLEITESSGKIRVEGEFYWPVPEPTNLLRRREGGDSSAKIEWICDEEIKEAVRFVLNSQYSTPLEDLIVQTSRVLGIKSTRKNTKERIEKLVQSGIESNELTLMPNEMIYFAE